MNYKEVLILILVNSIIQQAAAEERTIQPANPNATSDAQKVLTYL